ncbi:hypothetical protein ACFY97_32985 [Streptomyces klenkii]|uniref:hypothetical protein n=1 Tax=Streptomyces klenkii TaxID=1420899 RepID=UPI0036E9CBC9
MLALPMPDQKSSFILTGMAVVLVLLLWWLLRAVARQGGVRRACRRAAWELRVTRRAFAAPFRARGLHRRRVRTLMAFLADPAVPALVDHALTGAERAAGEGCRTPAAAVSADRRRVAVVVAGRSSRAAAAPWRDARDEPGDWTWSAGAAAVAAGAEALPARRTLPLVVGVDRLSGATVVADWMCGPPAVSLEGDVRVARSVLQALAAQLDLLAGGPVVRVARGVHPRYPGRELDRILDELEADADGAGADGAGLPVVLVCWAPTPGQRERLAALCASGRVRALVGGRLAGHCWTLHAEPGGRLLAPGAGIDVESAALSRAVGSAVKRFRRRGTGWWTARDGQVPPAGDGDGPVVRGSGPVEEAGPADVSASRTAGTAPPAQEPNAVPLRDPGSALPPAAAAEPAPGTAEATIPVPPGAASLPGGGSTVPAAASAPAPDTAGTTGPATAPLAGNGPAVPPAATTPAPPAIAPLPGAAPAPRAAAASAPPAATASAPAAPVPPAPTPPDPAPGPYAGDFAEPETAAGTSPSPGTAPAEQPPAPPGAVWLEPEPEPGSGAGSRPAPGVSASRTHPDRTPEHP